MEDFLSFVAENSAWFIGIAVFLLFALIGYIAEKSGYRKIEVSNEEMDEEEEVEETPVEELEESSTESGQQETTSKKKKKKKKKHKKEESAVEEVTPTFEDLNIIKEGPISEKELDKTPDTVSDVVEESNNLEVKPLEENLNVPLEVSPTEDLTVPLENTPTEDLNAPLNGVPVEDLSVPLESTPAEDLNAPLEGTTNAAPVIEEIPADLYAPLEGTAPVDAEPANLDTVGTTAENEAEQDDIWKF